MIAVQTGTRPSPPLSRTPRRLSTIDLQLAIRARPSNLPCATFHYETGVMDDASGPGPKTRMPERKALAVRAADAARCLSAELGKRAAHQKRAAVVHQHLLHRGCRPVVIPPHGHRQTRVGDFDALVSGAVFVDRPADQPPTES